MSGTNGKTNDVIFAILAFFAKTKRPVFEWSHLSFTFDDSARKLLGDKVHFAGAKGDGLPRELETIIELAEERNFCVLERPERQFLLIDMKPEVVAELLARVGGEEVIREAADAWHESYLTSVNGGA